MLNGLYKQLANYSFVHNYLAMQNFTGNILCATALWFK